MTAFVYNVKFSVSVIKSRAHFFIVKRIRRFLFVKYASFVKTFAFGIKINQKQYVAVWSNCHARVNVKSRAVTLVAEHCFSCGRYSNNLNVAPRFSAVLASSYRKFNISPVSTATLPVNSSNKRVAASDKAWNTKRISAV